MTLRLGQLYAFAVNGEMKIDQSNPLNKCELITVRSLADVDGHPCAKPATDHCADCGIAICEAHAKMCGTCRQAFCTACFSYHGTADPKPAAAEDRQDGERKTA